MKLKTFSSATIPQSASLTLTALVLLQSLSLAQTNTTNQDSTINATKEPPVKLFEPYPPKPSAEAPAGWEIHILEGSVIENLTVLRNKREIKVTVPAYELVPIPINGENLLFTKDPGFDPTLGAAQTNTIGALLTQYLESVTQLQTKLDNSIQELEATLKNNTPNTKDAPTKDPTGPKQPPAPTAASPQTATNISDSTTPTPPKDVKTEPSPTPSPAR